MVGIKPDEISAILKQQLSGFKTEAELEEIGTVERLIFVNDEVGDGIARVYGLSEVQAGELVEFETGVKAQTAKTTWSTMVKKRSAKHDQFEGIK